MLVAYGFKPLAKALRQADEDASAEDAQRQFPGDKPSLSADAEVAWRTFDWMTVERQMDSGHSPLSLDLQTIRQGSCSAIAASFTPSPR